MLWTERSIGTSPGHRFHLAISGKNLEYRDEARLDEEVETEECQRLLVPIWVQAPHCDSLAAIVQFQQIFDPVDERIASAEQSPPWSQFPAVEEAGSGGVDRHQPVQQSGTEERIRFCVSFESETFVDVLPTGEPEPLHSFDQEPVGLLHRCGLRFVPSDGERHCRAIARY